jgi:hypothetical protein
LRKGWDGAWKPDSSKGEDRMKKLLASLVALFALLPAQAASADVLNLSAGVFPDDQLAALSSTGDPFAVGGGTADITQFAFSAHCKSATGTCSSSGTAPSGYAVVSDPTLGEAQGHVCAYRTLTTNPNQAQFWFVVEKGSGSFGFFPFLDVIASDVGGPNGSPDDLFVSPLGAPSCGAGSATFTGGPVTQGNIVVKP